jgi:hypothetical protein
MEDEIIEPVEPETVEMPVETLETIAAVNAIEQAVEEALDAKIYAEIVQVKLLLEGLVSSNSALYDAVTNLQEFVFDRLPEQLVNSEPVANPVHNALEKGVDVVEDKVRGVRRWI